VAFPTASIRLAEYWSRRDYAAVEKLAREVVDTARPIASLRSQTALGALAMLRGQLREGERRYAQTNEARARLRGDIVSPHDVAYIRAMTEGALRGDASRGLAILDSTARATPQAGVPPVGNGEYLFALAYARLGNPEKAREVLAQREARLDAAGLRRDLVARARVRGAIAIAENNLDSAVTNIRRSDLDADGLPTNGCTACTPLFLGLAFDRAAQADSARAYLTRYAEMPGTDRWIVDRHFLAPALFRLGELYADASDTKRATEYYGRFVDLWDKADPDLQPRVAEARARIDRLNRATR
jgi:tetratricopeptide (TPR) repeat protein